MRRDLGLQQMQSGIQRLTLEFAARQIEGHRLAPRSSVLLPEQRRDSSPGRHQHAEDGQEAEFHQPVSDFPERRRPGMGGHK